MEYPPELSTRKCRAGHRQGANGISTSATASWVEAGGTHNWLMKRLKGLSRVLIFCRTTVPSDGNNFGTRYFTSSTDRTVSPTLMGATRTEKMITRTAGEGTAERPRNWKEDLKARKTQVWQK